VDKNKSLQPQHVLGYIAGILILLGSFTFLVKGESIHLFGKEIRFLTLQAAFTPNKPVKKKDITKFVQVDTTMAENIAVDTTIKNDFKSDGKMGAPAGGNLSADAATSLQYNERGKEALIRIFEKLEQASKGKKVRILHYGDSQIEGDRMTSYIRNRMQLQFGGFGPGTIPAKNEYSTITFKQTVSPNFQRYTCFGGASLKSRKYGSMNTAARFTPEADSSSLASTIVKEAFIEIEPTNTAYARARTFNNARMFYTSCLKPCKIKVFNGSKLIHEDSLIADGKFHELELQFAETPKKLRYEFAATVSPTIIGFSLESDFGVFVDNIGMRGSSGTFFGKIDQNSAVKMYEALDVEMVIMQFGGNSVPYLKDSSGVRNFAKNFKGQLNTLKKLRPNVTIVVIGPSDMSFQSVNGWTSYKMLPYLVAEMTRVTKDVGGSYWDLFSAMGGENSMPSWVDQGLAGRDYIHFTNKGASIASQLFFDAFGAAYAKWKQGTL
jgi:lysophospholipase L1-like esterase